MSTTADATGLEYEVATLRLRVESIEQLVGIRVPPSNPAPAEIQRLRDEVLAFTTAMFPGPVLVVETDDPEIAGRWYLVYHVTARGTAREIVAMNDRWYDRVRTVAGPWLDLFCLAPEVAE